MNAPLRHRGRRAFSYLEALLLTAILGITGAATGRALTSVAHAPEQNNDSFLLETLLVDKMEYLRSLPFSTLAADVPHFPSAYSDTTANAPIIHGEVVPRTVAIWYIVPATGSYSISATHMLRVTVSAKGRSVVSLVNEP
jgi:hypothetical protein